MTTTYNTRTPRQMPLILAMMLVVINLATTGCDFVDSNAVMDEPQLEEARLMELSEEPAQLVEKAKLSKFGAGQPLSLAGGNDAPLWHDLIGSWEYDEGNARGLPKITFSAYQRVRIETECSTHEGPFSAAGQGQLTIAYLALVNHACGLLAEDPMIRELETATHYKVYGSQLVIANRESGQVFNFTLAQSAVAAEPYRRGTDDDNFVGPPDGAPGDATTDDDPFVGPPDGAPNASPTDDDVFVGPPDGGEKN